MAAGEGSGSIVSTWEAENFTKFGAVTNAFFANGGVALIEELSSADSPITSWQSSTYADIPR